MLVTPKSWTSRGMPGANIEEPRGLLGTWLAGVYELNWRVPYVSRVIRAIEHVVPSFFFDVQLSGFSGSSGPSQVTRFGSIFASSSLLGCVGPLSRSESRFVWSTTISFPSSVW